VVPGGGLSSVEVTRLLKAWCAGDASSLDRLTPIVYSELRRLARRHLAGERPGHPLQPSALVNETFVRLLGGAAVEWENRAHFYAVCSQMMRQILIDFARAQKTSRRGNRMPKVNLSEVADRARIDSPPVDFIDLDRALVDLAALDHRKARVVELRYFGGLENAEVAMVLDISEPTVVRDWRVARAWLYDRLRSATATAAGQATGKDSRT
jgi:RNA polymerase sigma factor (TIGR02999 family)